MAKLIILNETEKWVVFIVGCIPPIRPLLMIIFQGILSSARSVSGHTRSNTHGRYGRSTELQSYAPHSKPQVRHVANVMSVLEGKDSEENILEEGGIVKTTDIRLSYENPDRHDGAASSAGASYHQEHVPPEAHLPDERV